MANAKTRYYNNQLKKGNITQSQANSAISGKGLNVAKPSVSKPANNSGPGFGQFLSKGSATQLQSSPGANDSNLAITGYDQGGAVYGNSDYSSNLAKSNKSNSSKSYSKPISVNTNQRSTAANLFNTLTGTQTANASDGSTPTPVKRGSETLLGRGLQVLSDPFGLGKGQNRLGMLADAVPGINNYLFNQPGMDYPVGAGLTPSQQDVASTVIGGYTGDPNKDYTNPAYLTADPNNQPYAGNDNGANFANAYAKATGNNRTPQSVSQPYTPAYAPQISGNQSSDISSIINALTQNQPDYTPIQNNESTRRMAFGNGSPMSNGAYSNGGGGYNVQGTMGSNNGLTDQNNPLDDVLMALGLKTPTAQAAEIPQQSYSSDYITGNTSPVPGITPQNMWNTQNGIPSWISNQSNTPVATTPQSNKGVGGSNNGGVTQQYAQGATGGTQKMPKFDNSGYKDAMKAQKRALDELIKSIKSQYAQSTTEGTTALDKSKQQDLLKLSGLFNFANQDPNSEQRLQYQQRTNNDYAGQLTDLLNKLAQGQAKDISGANQNYQSSLADIMQKQAAAKQAYQQQIQKQMSKAQTGRKSSTAGSGKITHKDIFNYVNDAIANGGTWGAIAKDAANQGIDTSTGSYIDQLLNNANKKGILPWG